MHRYCYRDGLAIGEQHSYNTTCQFPQVPVRLPAGNYYIGAIVTCPIDYSIENNTGYDKATLQIVHPAGYIYGQMKYKTQLPIRYARVKVFSDDNNGNPLDDRVIGQTNTNGNGIYGLIIPDDANSINKIILRFFLRQQGESIRKLQAIFARLEMLYSTRPIRSKALFVRILIILLCVLI